MSELADLFNHVQAALVAEDPGVQVVFGRRELPKQINRGQVNLTTVRIGRVVFHEGDPGGDIGEEVAPRWPGSHPRPLKDELEAFTVYLWGIDPTAPEDALKQHEATWALFCAWRRIVFLKAEGRCAIRSKRWQSPNRIERPFGKEIQVVCTIRSQVTDAPVAIVEGVGSTTTLTALGETETVTTEA